jgi:uncharacterized protein involved in type VI secretion and phage assembly
MQTSVRHAVANPNHSVTNPYTVEIPGTTLSLSIVKYELDERFNRPFFANITVTSSNMAISGADSIGRWSIFHIDAESSFAWSSARAVERLRTLHGVVTQWEHVSSSPDEATYRLRVEPRFALLRQTTDSRVFLDTTLQQIFKDSIVDRKVFEHFDIECQFDGKEQTFKQVLMYEESIEAFVSRLCRKAGIFYYFKHTDDDRRSYVTQLRSCSISQKVRDALQTYGLRIEPLTALSSVSRASTVSRAAFLFTFVRCVNISKRRSPTRRTRQAGFSAQQASVSTTVFVSERAHPHPKLMPLEYQYETR